MQQSSYNAFLEYIQPHLENNGITPDQFHCEYSTLDIKKAPIKETKNGWHFMNFSYTIEVYFERISTNHVAMLSALIFAFWNNTQDVQKHTLSNPKCTILDLGDNLKVLEYDIEVNDEIYLAPSENGPIKLGDKTFAPIPYQINTAESVTVTSND